MKDDVRISILEDASRGLSELSKKIVAEYSTKKDTRYAIRMVVSVFSAIEETLDHTVCELKRDPKLDLNDLELFFEKEDFETGEITREEVRPDE